MIALFLIVKNEERVLGRCLDSAQPLVDHTLVVDTGSTDSTVAIARNRAVVVKHAWKDFGHNRSLSFQAAHELFPDAKWGMTIDADMRIVCPDAQKFRDFLDKDVDGFSLLQVNHGTEYNNIRVMRLDRPWTCKGATHEFWACRGGTVEYVPKDVAYIDDVGDGGAKADKFERDERLLRKELEEEPSNERDVFYLANTLLCQGKLEEAAELYAKRVELRGWEQEVYFAACLPAHQDLRAAQEAHRVRDVGAASERGRPGTQRGHSSARGVPTGAGRVLQGVALSAPSGESQAEQ